jgi:hypothetical protein
MFYIYCGKFLSRKVVHNWVEKFSQGYSTVTDDARPDCDRSKDFYAAGFDALFKRWDKFINIGGRYVEK